MRFLYLPLIIVYSVWNNLTNYNPSIPDTWSSPGRISTTKLSVTRKCLPVLKYTDTKLWQCTRLMLSNTKYTVRTSVCLQNSSSITRSHYIINSFSYLIPFTWQFFIKKNKLRLFKLETDRGNTSHSLCRPLGRNGIKTLIFIKLQVSSPNKII